MELISPDPIARRSHQDQSFRRRNPIAPQLLLPNPIEEPILELWERSTEQRLAISPPFSLPRVVITSRRRSDYYLCF
jgi:hypothetical protein